MPLSFSRSKSDQLHMYMHECLYVHMQGKSVKKSSTLFPLTALLCSDPSSLARHVISLENLVKQ